MTSLHAIMYASGLSRGMNSSGMCFGRGLGIKLYNFAGVAQGCKVCQVELFSLTMICWLADLPAGLITQSAQLAMPGMFLLASKSSPRLLSQRLSIYLTPKSRLALCIGSMLWLYIVAIACLSRKAWTSAVLHGISSAQLSCEAGLKHRCPGCIMPQRPHESTALQLKVATHSHLRL